MNDKLNLVYLVKTGVSDIRPAEPFQSRQLVVLKMRSMGSHRLQGPWASMDVAFSSRGQVRAVQILMCPAATQSTQLPPKC